MEVYRKPTHTDKYLDFGSHHPIKQKQSAANTLLGYVYTIPDSSCTSTKNISDGAFVHIQHRFKIDLIFVPERCCAASVVKVNRYISDRFSWHFLDLCERRIELKRKSLNKEQGLDSTEWQDGGGLGPLLFTPGRYIFHSGIKFYPA